MLGRKGTLSHYRDNYSSYLFNIASNRPSQDQLIDLATGLTLKEEKMMCLHPEVDSTLYRNKIMNVFVTFICSFFGYFGSFEIHIEMVQWLRTHTSLVEDQSLVPSAHVGLLTIICNTISRYLTPSPDLQEYLQPCAYTPTQTYT